MTTERRYVHTEIVAIRWGDMDAMGHVNNVVYFRYMEQARIGFYDALGTRNGDAWLSPGAGPVVINAHCTFIKALVYPGTVEIKVFLGEAGRTSVMQYYELRPSYDSATLYAEGSAKACWIDIAKRKSIPLPAAVRALASP